MSEFYKNYTLDEWENKFDPVQDDEGEIFYETYESDAYERDYKALMKKAAEMAEGTNKEPYMFVWTRLDGDDGKLYLANGIRYVNRLDYCVTRKPWVNREIPKEALLEVDYEE